MGTTVRPSKNHFLVKIEKQKQTAREEKEGMFYLPVQKEIIGMTRHMQFGEIVDIGAKAAETFPEAEVGHHLLFHHFIENSKKDGTHNYLVDADENFNYYVVSPIQLPGKNQPTFGVHTGSKFIMHPNFVMMNGPEKVKRWDLKQKEALHVFANTKLNRDEINTKLAELKAEVEQITQGNIQDIYTRDLVLAKQNYMEQLTAELNRSEYIPLKVVATNPILDKWFGRKVKKGDTLFCLNKATDYIVNFDGTEYRIVNVSYIGGLAA